MRPPALRIHDEDLVERFWARVNKDGPVVRPELGECWLWTGARQTRRGVPSYGIFGLGRRGRSVLAHRFACELQGGPMPEGSKACHRCDNPLCVRPAHLFAGTQKENLRDMREKGRARFNRFPKGTAHPNAKMDAGKAAALRAMRATGVSFAKIAEAFGIHPSTAHDIATGKTWREA